MVYSEEHEAYIKEHGDIQPDEDYEMNLGVRERRKLYLLAKGKCSLCRTDLFLREHNTDIATECHISSHKKNYPSKAFPRYDSNLTPKERDKSYNNAILLCRSCHEIIDNPENTQYTIEELHRIKENHEMYVIYGDKSKERDERRKQLQDWIHDHNQGLIDSFIKPWSESEFVDMPNLFAIEHLQSGYPLIWRLKDERGKTLRNQISEDEKTIKEYIKNKSYSKIVNIFDDEYLYQEEEGEFGRISIKKEADLIYELLDEFPDTSKLKDNYKIEDSKEIIETIRKDEPLNEMFVKVIKANRFLNEIGLEFEQGLSEIVFGIKEQHKELEGTCKVCKDWHDELEVLK